jgi:hypothetical protein
MMKYRVREAFIAVRNEPPNPFTFVTLPPGTTIAVVGTVRESGLVDVAYDGGGIVTVFTRDVDHRTELIEDEAEASA